MLRTRWRTEPDEGAVFWTPSTKALGFFACLKRLAKYLWKVVIGLQPRATCQPAKHARSVMLGSCLRRGHVSALEDNLAKLDADLGVVDDKRNLACWETVSIFL